jgi:hypothetical protein
VYGISCPPILVPFWQSRPVFWKNPESFKAYRVLVELSYGSVHLLEIPELHQLHPCAGAVWGGVAADEKEKGCPGMRDWLHERMGLPKNEVTVERLSANNKQKQGSTARKARKKLGELNCELGSRTGSRIKSCANEHFHDGPSFELRTTILRGVSANGVPSQGQCHGDADDTIWALFPLLLGR